MLLSIAVFWDLVDNMSTYNFNYTSILCVFSFIPLSQPQWIETTHLKIICYEDTRKCKLFSSAFNGHPDCLRGRAGSLRFRAGCYLGIYV